MISRGNNKRSEISIAVRNGKVILTTDQVLEIYNCKLAFEKYNNGIRARGLSVSVSRMYQVSPKTIRDIWNHTTWKPVTCHLWRSAMDLNIETPQPKSLGLPVLETPRIDNKTAQISCPDITLADETDAVWWTSLSDACTQSRESEGNSTFDDAEVAHADQNDPFHHDWNFW